MGMMDVVWIMPFCMVSCSVGGTVWISGFLVSHTGNSKGVQARYPRPNKDGVIVVTEMLVFAFALGNVFHPLSCLIASSHSGASLPQSETNQLW